MDFFGFTALTSVAFLAPTPVFLAYPVAKTYCLTSKDTYQTIEQVRPQLSHFRNLTAQLNEFGQKVDPITEHLNRYEIWANHGARHTIYCFNMVWSTTPRIFGSLLIYSVFVSELD